MKQFSEIRTDLDKINVHRTATEAAYAAMQEETSKIDPRFSAEVIADKTKEVRNKYFETIQTNFSALRDLSTGLMESRQFWSNKNFMLSRRSASETVNGHPAAPPKDPGIEANTRIQLMSEFKAMPTELLRLRVLAEKSAAISGGPAGGLHLALSEYKTRANTSEYEAVSIDEVILSEQKEALQMLDSARAAEITTEQIFKLSLGQKLSPVDVINAERAKQGGVFR